MYVYSPPPSPSPSLLVTRPEPSRQILWTTIYNLFFHPLARVPGPFLCRITDLPSYYRALKGDRHIWLWQNFQVYGRRFRAGPNLVVFDTPEAYNDIYSHKANVGLLILFTLAVAHGTSALVVLFQWSHHQN